MVGLKYPEDFRKQEAVELSADKVQELVNELMRDREISCVSSGNTVVLRSVDEEGVHEHVEVLRIKFKSKNYISKPTESLQ